MSIQAGWNSALATLGRIAGAKKIIGGEAAKINKNIKANTDAQILSGMRAEQDSINKSYARKQARIKQADQYRSNEWQGPMAPAEPQNNMDSQEDLYRGAMSEFNEPELGTPAGQAMMEQQVAMQQAAEAAAIANMAPQNHGYMESLEQQVESTSADPMAELNRMTNDAMDEMDRRANMGGNN